MQSPETSPAGVRKQLSEVLKYAGHVSTFHGIFGVDKAKSKYEGTLFRFPLRKPENKSKILSRPVTVTEIKRSHFESFKVEAPIILLFLRNVVKVSICEYNPDDGKIKTTFSVQVKDDYISSLLKQRELFHSEQKKKLLSSLKSFIQLYGVTVRTTRHSEKGTEVTNIYNWLVLNVLGTTNSEVFKLGKVLSSFPCIGLACQVPVPLKQSFSCTSLNEKLIDIIDPLLKSGSSFIGQLYLPLKSNTPLTDGKAFCYLPLPNRTFLPIHVNGSFAVASNRRSIAWPDHDVRNEETDWNEIILKKMIAPAYSLLLLINSKLFRFEKPLNTTIADDFKSAYSLWPIFNEIKNEYIWRELLDPVLSTLQGNKVLWSDVNGGKWVSLNESYLALSNCPPIAIKALQEADLPVVLLPPEIYDTLSSVANLGKVLMERAITPHILRINYPKKFQCPSREEEFVLLRFLLSDIGGSNISEMYNIPLLPLLDGSCCAFESKMSDNVKYLLPSSLIGPYKIIAPGTESMIIDYTISREVYKLLEYTQIKLADYNDYFQVILKHSILTWAEVHSHPRGWITWEPGKNRRKIHPLKMWLTEIWKFIHENKCFEDIIGLPIVPMEVNPDSFYLVPYEASAQFCYVSRYSRSHEWHSALKKLQFVVVDEVLTCDCSVFSNITLNQLLDVLPSNKVELVNEMTTQEREALLSFIVQQSVTLPTLKEEYITKIRTLPIVKAIDKQSKYTYLSLNDRPFLCPSEVMISKPFPPGMLTTSYDDSTTKFLKRINILSPTFADFCVYHWIPFAMDLLHKSRFEDGERIIASVLLYLRRMMERRGKNVDHSILNCLKSHKIICNKAGEYYRASDMYDTCKEFEILVDNLAELTPDKKYSPYNSVLHYLGLKTWKQIRKNRDDLYSLLKLSVENACKGHLESSLVLMRGKFLLEEIQDSASALYDGKKLELARIRFLQAAPRPAQYPNSLKWFTNRSEYEQGMNLYSIQELLPWRSELANLVGSVVPIASWKYFTTSSSEKYFKELRNEDVLEQLRHIESAKLQASERSVITPIVMSIYHYLNSQKLQLEKILAPFRDPPQFITSQKFVKTLPFNMQPFLYCFPSEYSHLTGLWNVKSNINNESCLNILKQLQAIPKLDTAQEKLIFDIIDWLFDKKYAISSENMLLLNCDLRLEMASSMVYDDREWSSGTSNMLGSLLTNKSVKFVHPKVSSAVANHFGVTPLSRIVAPSANLKIQYTRAGQHESITNRISKIVHDYGSDIDIFKELIQNADDAGATEVKFLIDWRRHPDSKLLAKGMAAWQGPALWAFNNAQFSDEDLNNICKVAGESKKSDPTKIGRFGIGFCATYHLTDVPSFVTGKYLVIFDPHTCYLGDRVSHSEPGMRIDLVETQSDLWYYKDQFKPYDDVFGCDIFNLKEKGYPGTLFRFPFRNSNTSKQSEISKKMYDVKETPHLISALKTYGEELVLFLKHVNKISFFELKKDSSTINELFSISRCLQNTDRLDILDERTETYSSHTECSIVMKDGKKSTTSNWFMCSYRGANISDDSSLQGLLPFGEIAMKLKRDECYKCQDKVKGKIFCFLPLPITSGLNFHINGYFVVSKDRRNIPIADETAPYTKWNVSLCSKVVSYAYIDILKCFADTADMKAYSSDIKKKFLESYYQLWDFKIMIIEGVATMVKKSIEMLLSATPIPLVWSEVNSGNWFSPKDVVLYEDEPKHLLPSIHLDLLRCGHRLVVLPKHVSSLIKENVSKVLNYKKFILDVLFPLINDEHFKKSWEIHLLHILSSFSFGYVGHLQKWPVEKLQSEPCVPCQSTTELKRVKDVVDCSESTITKLFDTSEGRFPIKSLLENKQAKENLIFLGMSSSLLSVELLINRATSVQHMKSLEGAMKRSHVITEYIKNLRYDYNFSVLKEKLSNIPFLPPFTKPDDIQLPWFADQSKSPFCTPSELYDYKYRDLVFTVAKVVAIEDKIVSCRLLTKASPDSMEVVQHLKVLIKATDELQQNNKETILFLDKAVSKIYAYFENQLKSWETLEDSQLVEALQSIDYPLWHDDVFKSPKYVVYQCSATCPPYLSKLSERYSRFEILFSEVFKVQMVLSLESMICVLNKVYEDNLPPTRLSNQLLQFVIQLSSDVAESITDGDTIDGSTLFLPDSEGIMRNVSSLACDNHQSDFIKKSLVYRKRFDKGSVFFVHGDVPRNRAIKLGVYPLLDAVMKDFEDKDFLSGEEYGQQEDLCTRLNSILSKYPVDVSILQEFVQNADDAQASEVIFVLDHRTNHPNRTLFCESDKWKELQQTPALCIVNNRKFSEADIKGISNLGEGNKQDSTKSIGKFGIGFNVAYHITDSPSFLSYGEHDIPENLCAFDPTYSYVGNRKPGRRWRLQYKEVAELKDQFSPYLFPDICGGSIKLSYKQSGYVVFRLPLTKVGSAKKYWHLNEHKFSMSQMKELLTVYSQLSKEILLFLNNVKELSCIEIRPDGQYVQMFKVHSIIPQQFEQTCNQFVSQCDSYKESVLDGTDLQEVSAFHRLDIVYSSSFNTDLFETRSWLIQKMLFGKFNKHTLQVAVKQNLRAVGAVATPLKALGENLLQEAEKHVVATPLHAISIEKCIGRLFCYLPLPITTSLPVHAHGHFITDDSRKHLETVKIAQHDWNFQLINNIIAPAYLKLILNTKTYLVSEVVSQDLVEMSAFLYNLFPPFQDYHPFLKEQETEDICSNLYRCFYAELSDCQAPLFLMENKSPNWFPLNKIYFCVSSSSVFEKGSSLMNEKLGNALQELGMNVICSASHIPLNLNHFKLPDQFLYQCEVIDFLSRVDTNNPGVTDIIKANISAFLMYCLDGRKPKKVPSLLLRIPLILTVDGCLQKRWNVYAQKYSKLLLNSLNCILDESSCKNVRHKLGHVIEIPNLAFISSEIPLPNSKIPISLKDGEKEIVPLLWECLIVDKQYQSTSFGIKQNQKTSLNEYFMEKPVLPANGGLFYPMCASKTLVEISDKRVSHVLQKLNYRNLDMPSIGITDKQLLLNIRECVFSKNEDIIACFQQQKPTVVELSLEEAHIVLQLLQSCSTQELESVSEIIGSLKIFCHATGKHCVALENSRIFVFPEKVPIAGTEIIEQSDKIVFLKAPEKLWTPVYQAVIPDFDSIIIEPSQLYCNHIIPNIGKMEEEERIQHVDFVLKELRKESVKLLQFTPFLQHGSALACASELYDPEVTFFCVFRKTDLPSKPWHEPSRISFLRHLGLQSHVSYDEWLRQARNLFHSSSCQNFVNRSELLYSKLIEFIPDSSDEDESLSEFLREASEIQFMLSNEKVIRELDFLQEKFNLMSQNEKVVRFKEAVFCDNALLAFHKHFSLPEECHELKTRIGIIKHLGIIYPLTSDIVVENLILLCNSVNKHTWVTEENHEIFCNKVYQIILLHYKFLEGIEDIEDEVLDKLKYENCIVVKSGGLLKAIKPCHTIQQNSQFNMEPFCYILPREIGYYQKFIGCIGIQESLTASSYVCILQNVSDVTKGDLVNANEDTKELAVRVFNSLIKNLRETGRLMSDDYHGPLISEDYKFLPVSKLVYNDARWYSSRISSSFYFMLTPEPDNTGSRKPPTSLKVPLLSNLVKEVLHENCKFSNARCENDELFYTKKRMSRCECAHRIMETFTSVEFFEGMCRIYYTDHQLNPTEKFKESVLQFQKYEVACLVIPLKTVLLEKGVINRNSEDDAKLCFLSVDDGIMYIHPHFENFEIRDLLKEVASEINNALGCPLKSEQHVTSMFMCAPNEIQSNLTFNRVTEYSINTVKSISFCEVGTVACFSSCILREALIFVNYDAGETVKYYTSEGMLIYAKVVKSHNYSQGTPITRQCIEIVTDKEANDGNDIQSFLVSPLEIFKILTLPQMNSLEKGELLFSKPVVLAAIPQTLEKTKKWICKLYNSEDILMYSGLTVCMINYRIYAHFQYQFQTGNITKQNFTAATFQVLDCIVDNELPFTDTNKQPKLCEKLDNLSMLFANMDIDDFYSSSDSESSDSFYSLDNAGSHGSSQGNSPEPEMLEQSAHELSQYSAANVQPNAPASQQNLYPAPAYRIQQSLPLSGTQFVQGTPVPPAQQSNILSSGVTRTSQTVSTAQFQHPTTRSAMRPISVSSRFVLQPRTVAHRPMRIQTRFRVPERDEHRVPPLCEIKARAWLEQALEDYIAAQDIYGSDDDISDNISSACKHPALVCFLSHDAVVKCLIGLYYTYLDEGHIFNCTNLNLVQLLSIIKSVKESDGKELTKTCEEVVMTVSGHDTKCRFPSAHIPACAPAAIYTASDARESLAAVARLMKKLKSIQLLTGMIAIPDLKFRSSLKSSFTNSKFIVYYL